jgi:hypothetical protein
MGALYTWQSVVFNSQRFSCFTIFLFAWRNRRAYNQQTDTVPKGGDRIMKIKLNVRAGSAKKGR